MWADTGLKITEALENPEPRRCWVDTTNGSLLPLKSLEEAPTLSSLCPTATPVPPSQAPPTAKSQRKGGCAAEPTPSGQLHPPSSPSLQQDREDQDLHWDPNDLWGLQDHPHPWGLEVQFHPVNDTRHYQRLQKDSWRRRSVTESLTGRYQSSHSWPCHYPQQQQSFR